MGGYCPGVYVRGICLGVFVMIPFQTCRSRKLPDHLTLRIIQNRSAIRESVKAP